MKTILKPLATGFKLAVRLHQVAYRQGWLRTQRLNRPVVSVGNLTMGGTGKTPLVAYTAQRLLKAGWKPAILTRGYGRRRGARLLAIEPAPGRVADPREVGDEPALLAKALPEVPIVVSTDRYRAGCLAEKRFDVDLHLLDDGFQHLALARDVDIVLLDVTQEHTESALLPAGRLREPLSALERAHLVVLTRIDLADPQPLKERVRRINPQARIFHSTTKLCGLVDVATGRIYPPGAFQGEPVYAFCGLGNSRAFFADLRKWGFSVVAQHAFRDHHVYTDASLALVFLEMKLLVGKRRPAAFITTEKDAMNLPPPQRKGQPPFLACVIEVESDEPEAFEEALLMRLEPAGAMSRVAGSAHN